MRLGATIVCAALISACATITKGTDQQVSLDTPGYAGAEYILTSKEVGRRRVVTPAVVTLPKSRENIAVQCQKGCARGSGVIASNTEGMTAGNIIAGVQSDVASGAMNHYNDNNQIALTADPTCRG